MEKKETLEVESKEEWNDGILEYWEMKKEEKV
jgi:hypothetical protein